MDVAVMFGVNTEEIINRIAPAMDKYTFYKYDTITDLIKTSTVRHIFFDRIVLVESMVDKDDLSALNDYLVEYSDSTKVVFACKSSTSEMAEAFNAVLRSPLYAIVYTIRTNISIVKDFMELDPSELRVRYAAENIKALEEKQNKTVEKNPNKGQRGILSRFSGSKKGNLSENQENESAERDIKNSAVTSGNQIGSTGQRSVSESMQNSAQNNTYNYMNNNAPQQDTLLNLGVADSPRTSVGTSQNQPQNFENSQEVENLGLGAFGFGHTDTGFLDEYEVDSIAGNVSQNSSGIDLTKGEGERSAQQEKSRGTTDKRGESEGREKSTQPKIKKYIPDMSECTKTIFVIGERGVGVTTLVVDMALSLYSKGESVLLVDLDSLRNGLLSYIDTRDFYDKGCEDGIDSKNPFEDEDADIVSNGYGSDVSKSSLGNLLTDKAIKKNYDRIIIDCPLDCIKSLSERVVRGNTVIVLVRGDRGSILATSMGLTDRTQIESNLERYIMETCMVGVLNCATSFDEDVRYVRDTFLFTKGCWLDNIE